MRGDVCMGGEGGGVRGCPILRLEIRLALSNPTNYFSREDM